jgi:hypothetical protein
MRLRRQPVAKTPQRVQRGLGQHVREIRRSLRQRACQDRVDFRRRPDFISVHQHRGARVVDLPGGNVNGQMRIGLRVPGVRALRRGADLYDGFGAARQCKRFLIWRQARDVDCCVIHKPIPFF